MLPSLLIESYATLTLFWIGVTILSRTAFRWPVKLFAWLALAHLIVLLRLTVLHGWSVGQAGTAVMAPMRAVWLVADYFIIVGIARSDWRPGYQIAAWFAVAAVIPMLPGVLTGRGDVGWTGIMQFVIPALVVASVFRPEVANWMDTRAKALLVTALFAGFGAVLVLSVMNVISTGSPAALTLASVGLVGCAMLPSSALNELMQEVL